MQDTLIDTRVPGETIPLVRSLINLLIETHGQLISGIYITGSIALNDFQLRKSDLDFVVLCRKLPGKDSMREILRMHQTIARHHAIAKLNGCYISEDHLDARHSSEILYLRNGKLFATASEMTPILLLELKTTAITLHGIPAATLPVRLEETGVREFLHQNINTYWRQWARRHSNFAGQRSSLILFPRLTEWSVLGVMRQLYTLRTGCVISKTGAGHYGLGQLPERFSAIVRESMNIRTNKEAHVLEIKQSYYLAPSIKRCNDTLACLRYVIDLFNRDFAHQRSST